MRKQGSCSSGGNNKSLVMVYTIIHDVHDTLREWNCRAGEIEKRVQREASK